MMYFGLTKLPPDCAASCSRLVFCLLGGQLGRHLEKTPRFWTNSIRPCESIGDASNKMIPLFFQPLPSMRVVCSGGVVMVSQHSQKSGKYSRFGGREMGEIWPEIIEAKNGQC